MRAIEPVHTIRLEYCVACNYLDKVIEFTQDALSRWGSTIKSLELTPTGWGTFELTVDGELVFSAWALARFAKPTELLDILEDRLGPPPDYQYDHGPEEVDEDGFSIRGKNKRALHLGSVGQAEAAPAAGRD